MNELEEIDQVFTDATEIREHLDRVLASERFRKTPSLTHLLEYLVTKTLQGEQGQTKEATVALAVFSRSSDFDSRIDNIVRVHAHRLRKVLKVYYEVEGAAEKIMITIPTGGYIAQVLLAATAGPAGHRVGELIVADSQKLLGPNTSAGRKQ